MFGFGGKRGSPTPARTRAIGIDCDASRLRCVEIVDGKTRSIPLEPPHEELPLYYLREKVPLLGRAAREVRRLTPHLVHFGFLDDLGVPVHYVSGRGALTPESLLTLTLERVKKVVDLEGAAVEVALPRRLTAIQLKLFRQCAVNVKFPLGGVVTRSSAIVAQRAEGIRESRTSQTVESSESAEATVPEPVTTAIRQLERPCSILFIDADDVALDAVITLTNDQGVKSGGSMSLPQGSLRRWRELLIDGVSDRSVRICRRDPRDSAEAERALDMQLDDVLDQTAAGRTVSLTLRGEQWFQELPHRPEDFDAYCAALARQVAQELRHLIESVGAYAAPVEAWLTPAAAKLPGLAYALHKQSPEEFRIRALAPNAVAEAAAAIALRRLRGNLLAGPLDDLPPA